jgi:FimV-like protein
LRTQFVVSRGMLFIVLTSLMLAPASAQTGKTDSVGVRKLTEEAEIFSQKNFDNQKALEKLQEALALDSTDFDALWLMSRTYADIGELLPTTNDAEKQKQLETYEMALAYANKAIAVNPSGSMAYARRAIANGRIALFRGVWESLDIVKQTKADCEKAISLDGSNNAAYYVLGRAHAKVSEKPRFIRWPLGLGWASVDDAVKNYEKAIALRPDFIMYRLDAARSYVELDDYKKAKENLQLIPTLSKQNQSDDKFRQEAKDLLEKIKDKS